MALCRCEKHSPKNIEKYVNYSEPKGYPDTSSICGRNGCVSPGLIWLTNDEFNQFLNGVTLYNYASNVSKVEVQSNLKK